jgi:hypothetical protein
MRFELKPDNRNASDEELLNDLKRIAHSLQKDSVESREYDKYGGRFHHSTISRRFNGWNNALEKAGLIIRRYSTVSNEELLDDLKRIATILGKESVESREYDKQGGQFHHSTISSRFNGWNSALKMAGLIVTNFANLSDEELFENMEEVWVKIGSQPSTRNMVKPFSKYSKDPYLNRFGTWRKALEAFVECMNLDIDEAQVLNKVEITHYKDTQGKEIEVKHETKRDPGMKLRFFILQRDKFKCVKCGDSPATNPVTKLEVDHIKPWANGGETVRENLQTLCSRCNGGKSNLYEI